jgi:hypothetical protein
MFDTINHFKALEEHYLMVRYDCFETIKMFCSFFQPLMSQCIIFTFNGVEEMSILEISQYLFTCISGNNLHKKHHNSVKEREV